MAGIRPRPANPVWQPGAPAAQGAKLFMPLGKLGVTGSGATIAPVDASQAGNVPGVYGGFTVNPDVADTPWGPGLSFNGSTYNEIRFAGRGLTATSGVTLTLWALVKLSSIGVTQRIVGTASTNAGFHLGVNSNKFCFVLGGVANVPITGAVTPSTGVWYAVAVAYSQANQLVTLYQWDYEANSLVSGPVDTSVTSTPAAGDGIATIGSSLRVRQRRAHPVDGPGRLRDPLLVEGRLRPLGERPVPRRAPPLPRRGQHRVGVRRRRRHGDHPDRPDGRQQRQRGRLHGGPRPAGLGGDGDRDGDPRHDRGWRHALARDRGPDDGEPVRDVHPHPGERCHRDDQHHQQRQPDERLAHHPGRAVAGPPRPVQRRLHSRRRRRHRHGQGLAGPHGVHLVVSSNRMVPTSGFPTLASSATRTSTGKAYGPDQYVRAKLYRPSNTNSIGVRFRVHENQSYSLSGYNGIRAQLDALVAGDTIRVFREQDGVTTQLGSTYSIPGGVWTDGVLLEMEAVGTTLTVYVNGVSVLTATESTFNNIAGQAGVYATAASGSWDDFEAGVPSGARNLVWGPLIGGPATNGSIKVRARSSHASTLSLQYSTDSTFATGVTTMAGVDVDSTTDFTAGWTLTGLTPSTTYYCRVRIDGTPKGYAPFATFKTAPSPGTPGVYRFAIASCVRQLFYDGACAALAAKGVDALIFNGDSAYNDTIFSVAASTQDQYRGGYRDQLTPGIATVNWSALQSKVAAYFMWDDHEILDNWSGLTSDAQYIAAKAAWLEAHGGTTPDPVQSGELYYAFGYGDVGVFVLDQRSHRGGGSILGATQLADLKSWLSTNNQTYKVKLIVTPVPQHAFPMTGSDAWYAGFQTERDALYDWIATNNIRGVTWFAGDQHQAGYYKEVRNGVNYHTFQCSGIDNQTIFQTSLNAAIKWVWPSSHGRLRHHRLGAFRDRDGRHDGASPDGDLHPLRPGRQRGGDGYVPSTGAQPPRSPR
jgi:phosphodiesterase/alkaline phosphatase D-like protein